MNVSELVATINDLADESESVMSVVSWINDAIAKINVELSANFPFLDYTDSEDTPAFPETWQRMVLIPFGVGRVKQKDSSQFEYTDAYNEFIDALLKMKTNYEVPEIYKDTTSKKPIMMDLKNGWYSKFGGW